MFCVDHYFWHPEKNLKNYGLPLTPRHRFTLVLLRFTPALLSITEHYWAICLVGTKRLTRTNVLSDHAVTSQCSTRGNVTHSATYEQFFLPLFFIFNLIFSRHPLGGWSHHNDRVCQDRNGTWKLVSDWELWTTYQQISIPVGFALSHMRNGYTCWFFCLYR
jgi:hypothetical protein